MTQGLPPRSARSPCRQRRWEAETLRSVLEPVALDEDERDTLERWACRLKSGQALALRCRIVLACTEGGHVAEVAERLGVDPLTAGKGRRRFLAHRQEGLHDEPRAGARALSPTRTWRR